MLIGDILGVFRQGKALKDASVWKSRTALANAFVGILSGVTGVLYAFGVIQIQIDSETIQAIALGVASVYGVANSLMHVATAETAGVPVSANAEMQPSTETPSQAPDNTYFG